MHSRVRLLCCRTESLSLETKRNGLNQLGCSAVGPSSRQQIRQREPLSHMTEVNAVRAGKERKKSNNQFDALSPCPPPLPLPPSLSFFLSLPCAHSSLALSLPGSLFNGGLEQKAGTGGLCGSTAGSRGALA